MLNNIMLGNVDEQSFHSNEIVDNDKTLCTANSFSCIQRHMSFVYMYL